MALAAGHRIGAYEVLGPLGSGGMGEIYRARDTHLGREVALKVLPDPGSKPHRRARFEREARLLATLSHPAIAAIHGLENDHGAPVLVMELVEGQTLHARLRRGPLGLHAALELGRQIAEALEAAHEKGIIHRDLKPSNVMLNAQGRVKLLDFGLAKTLSQDPAAACSDVGSDTLTTANGDFLGTAPYMSPEQAQGWPVDKRTDIWSFGCVLYELLTGKRAFGGSTTASVALAVLRGGPDWNLLRAAAPNSIERLIRRCLEKDSSRRLREIADARLEIEEALAEAVAASTRGRLGRDLARGLWWLLPAAGVLALAAVVTIVRFAWQRATAARPASLTVTPLTAYPGMEYQPSLSPDGNRVAFVWDGGEDNHDIYVEDVGSQAPLRLTSDPDPECCPAWSPDGRWIAFVQNHGDSASLRLVPSGGGVERRLQPLRTWFGTSLSWSPDGRWIAFSDSRSEEGPFGLYLVSFAGLERRQLTEPPASVTGDAFPAFSPDGSRIAFARIPATRGGLVGAQIQVVAAAAGEPRRVLELKRFVGGLDWGARGREILFTSDLGSTTGAPRLWSVPESGGTPQAVPLPDNAAVANVVGAAAPSVVSRLFRISVARTERRRLAYARSTRDTNIWRVGTRHAAMEARAPRLLIGSTRLEEAPQFSPDGRRIAFSSNRTTLQPEIWTCASDGGSCERVTASGVPSGTPRWSPDGTRIVFDTWDASEADLHVVDLRTGRRRRFRAPGTGEAVPSWSHDGRWIYFASDRSGFWDVWKMPTEGGVPVPVTSHGGFAAFESSDGAHLYYTKYRTPGIWRTPVAGGSEQKILDCPECWGYWALADDGIYYLHCGSKLAHTIRFFEFATGEATTLARMEAGPACGESGLALSPDGRWLLYEGAVDGSDLVLAQDPT